ncbi:MAG: DUF951 domain-containing protein [Chloroflexota bacterium]
MAKTAIKINLDDMVQLRKKHACGGDVWRVTRLGTDIGLVCSTCGRRIMIARGKFNRQLKAILDSNAPES